MTPDSCTLEPEVVPSRVRRPTPRHRHPPWLVPPVDHLLDEHRLPTPAPPNRPILHPARRAREVDDLDRSEHEGPGLPGVEVGGLSVDVQWSSTATDVVGVERLAQHVNTWAQHGRHPGTCKPWPRLRTSPTVQAVGRLQADAAHTAVADLLGHLGGDGLGDTLEYDVHLDGTVDLGRAWAETPRR